MFDFHNTPDETEPFDVLVTSYTLLQQEAKLLAAIDWQVIVLDEAQAIKNMETKRSRAAMSLNGRFRLLTTGTPIENHLGELWNLFNFILPGLLGSLESFNKRFGIPIERNWDEVARKKLKKIISMLLRGSLFSKISSFINIKIINIQSGIILQKVPGEIL